MDIKITKESLRKGKTIYDLPLKVAYYARVSTDKSDQLNSLENQQKYFEDMINENKNWQLCGKYIDEGISGTAVKNRTEFLKMIESGTKGKIDLILTKEISRFSRNTLDSIKYTQYLLEKGVIVYFISDNLNTIQEDAEFRLTIMSSLAQDEVRKLSERVKFGINRMIKERKLIGGNLTGYYKKNGKYLINNKEAPLIKYLFKTYAKGNASLTKISKSLAQMGYLNSKGQPYSQTTLAKFLTNPRYKGYYTAKLTEVQDYKTHKKRVLPKEQQIIEKDSRIPQIVSEDLWNQANNLYQSRKKIYANHILNSEKKLTQNKYSCLIYCQHCNKIFIRSGGSNRKNNPTWVCQIYKNKGINTCQSPIIKEQLLDSIFTPLLKNILKKNNVTVAKIYSEYYNQLNNSSHNQTDINNQINILKKQQEKLLDLSLQELINDEEFKNHHEKLEQKISTLKSSLSNSDKFPDKTKTTLENLKSSLINQFKPENQLPSLIPLLIKKIVIEKINNNRHHIKLHIYFTYHNVPLTKEIKLSSS